MKSNALLILRIPPPFGGGEIVSQLLYSGLKEDYNFYLIKRNDHSKSKQQNISLFSYFHGLKYIFIIIRHIRILKPSKVFIGLPKTFGAFTRNAIIIYYCYFKKITVYAELHGMSFPFLNNRLYALLFKNIINKIKKIRVLSTSIKQYLSHNGYSNKIEIIDNAIERPPFSTNVFNNISDKLSLLYLGLISESKGFSRIIEIARILKEKGHSNFKINVIGEWHSEIYKRYCEKLIDSYKIHNFLSFHGALYNSDKWQKISENTLIIHLSRFDGQPLSLIECMSVGIPAIATKVGAIPEMITNKENGFLIDNDYDVVDIFETILNRKINLAAVKQKCISTYNERFAPEILFNKMRNFIDS